MLVHYILLIVLLLSALFFAAMEVAFVSANDLRIELDKKQDRHFSQVVELFMDNPAQYYSTMVIGNLAVMVSLAALLSDCDFAWLPFAGNFWLLVAVQVVGASALYLIAGEILPKLIFNRESNNMLKSISLPVSVFYYLFYLLSRLVYHVSRFWANIFSRIKTTENNELYWGAVDWDGLSDEQVSDDDESNDVKLFRNALDFSSVKLRECMVPRPEIVAISVNDSVDTLKKLFVSSGLSRILVYNGSIDNIVGFAHSISMFQHPDSIMSITRNLPIVPESMPANKLLALFTQKHRSMALVVDEFGGTSGIVTMEDILEEIVGDIQDEHDKKRYREHRYSANHFQFSARLEIDYINEKYELELPVSEEYETLAGLILSHYGAIPKIQDVVSFDNFRFTILRATSTKIELVDLVVE